MLQDKVIVIVGGTSGLGLSAALACREAGARLVVVGRSPENAARAAERLGPETLVQVADATEPATAPEAVRAAVKRFGRIDGLYHVAGGSGRRQGDGPLDTISDIGWQYTLDLNLNSLFYSNRAAVRQFLLQGTGGSVLNMGSVLADSPAPRHFATHGYAAAKGAVEGLTLSCAAYYASRGIRFNVLAPALVDTPLARRAAENQEIMRYIATKQPLDGGRIGLPSDSDAAVLFFLSDASRFVTGQVLHVDGGWGVSEGQYAGPQEPNAHD